MRNIVKSRYKVYQCALSRTGTAYHAYRFAFFNDKIYIFKRRLILMISENDIFKFNSGSAYYRFRRYISFIGNRRRYCENIV